MNIQIIGAGMAGLLAGQMLRRYAPVIRERGASLPDNHGALLRFRTDAVSRFTGIPFKQVTVYKGIWDGERVRDTVSISDHNAYSWKVTREVRPRSILNLSPATRYIAPPTFLEDLARGIDIIYENDWEGPIKDEYWVRKWKHGADVTISTIPLYHLLHLVGRDIAVQFRSLPVWALRMTLPESVDVYQTIYFPYGNAFWYRASITGRLLIMEATLGLDNEHPPSADLPLNGPQLREWAGTCLNDVFSIPLDTATLPMEVKYHRHGKILPIPEDARRGAIVAMTDDYQVYSLGRFATWRQLLLDDVAHDVSTIERFIADRSRYSLRMAPLHSTATVI